MLIGLLLIKIKARECFKGFYDQWGGEYGDTEFTGVDIGKNSGSIVACGYSSSNYDGFVTFNKDIVTSRPLIGVFSKYIDI